MFQPLASVVGLRASSVGGQCLENSALVDSATLALTNDRIQLPPQSLEVGDLPVNIGQMLSRDLIHGFAGTIPLIRQVEQLADLVKGKTKLSCAANEAEPANV
jgi:hypothetical protein